MGVIIASRPHFICAADCGLIGRRICGKIRKQSKTTVNMGFGHSWVENCELNPGWIPSRRLGEYDASGHMVLS